MKDYDFSCDFCVIRVTTITTKFTEGFQTSKWNFLLGYNIPAFGWRQLSLQQGSSCLWNARAAVDIIGEPSADV